MPPCNTVKRSCLEYPNAMMMVVMKLMMLVILVILVLIMLVMLVMLVMMKLMNVGLKKVWGEVESWLRTGQ